MLSRMLYEKFIQKINLVAGHWRKWQRAPTFWIMKMRIATLLLWSDVCTLLHPHHWFRLTMMGIPFFFDFASIRMKELSKDWDFIAVFTAGFSIDLMWRGMLWLHMEGWLLLWAAWLYGVGMKGLIDWFDTPLVVELFWRHIHWIYCCFFKTILCFGMV